MEIKKNKNIVIAIILICLSICFFLVKKHIDNKYVFILVKETDNNCLEKCIISNRNMRIVSKMYKIDYQIINNSKASKKYKKFVKKYSVDTSMLVDSSTLFVIKKGKVYRTIDLYSLSGVKKALKDLDVISYIDDKELEFEDFINKYKSVGKSVFYVKTEEYDSEKFSVEVGKLAKKYNIKYNSVVYNMDSREYIVNIIDNSIAKKRRTKRWAPVLLIVDGEKILDYSYDLDINKIKKFFKKNKLIK